MHDMFINACFELVVFKHFAVREAYLYDGENIGQCLSAPSWRGHTYITRGIIREVQ